ncbi:MAG: glycosyltransferase, partial [Candidatus Aenigmarchaeota archaeon]|nr:glycosyltransferase [Candidatus Aenigmarchaeota archaeon]
MGTDVGVIIPAYNEEKNIEEVIVRLKKSLEARIIVVDDCSKDRTGEIARRNGAIVIRHKAN